MFHVKQNSKKEKIRKCPICSESNFLPYITTKDYFFTQEEFKLVKCSNCGFVITDPIPDDLSKYYETTEYLSHDTDKKGVIGSLYSYLRNINLKRKYSLITKFIPSGSLLDIGCGTGEVLHYFKNKNWIVTGIEPNEKAREFAKKNYELQIHDESELGSFNPGSFDAISMWHVLEHVSDINDRIKTVSKLLNDNGIIIIAVPNLNSPDSLKYGKYWAALDVPRHLYHFTSQSIYNLITKHNLKLVHTEPMKFDSYYVSMLSEKYLKNRFFLISAAISGAVSNFKARKNNNYSSMIFVVKKES